MISKWRASAKNLLYHYRVVLRGMVPFSPSWDPKKQKQVELDAKSLEYIVTMSKIIEQRSKLRVFFFFKKWKKKESLFLLPLAIFNDELLIIFYISFTTPNQEPNCLHCARKGVIIVVHDHWFGWLSCSSIKVESGCRCT